jgi:hypothetical protein
VVLAQKLRVRWISVIEIVIKRVFSVFIHITFGGSIVGILTTSFTLILRHPWLTHEHKVLLGICRYNKLYTSVFAFSPICFSNPISIILIPKP